MERLFANERMMVAEMNREQEAEEYFEAYANWIKEIVCDDLEDKITEKVMEEYWDDPEYYFENSTFPEPSEIRI